MYFQLNLGDFEEDKSFILKCFETMEDLESYNII